MPQYPPQRRSRSWLALLGVLALAAFALSGCNPASPMHVLNYDNRLAVDLSNLFWLIIYVAAGVFVVVEGVLLYAIIKFRERPGQPLPAQTHGNNRVEIAWTIAPTVVLALIAIPTVSEIFAAADVNIPNAMNIDVIGHQWWWEFRYTDKDLNIVTANEFHLPQGHTAVFHITSADVIHSFWVPRLGGKRDAIPGKTNEIWYAADKIGFYYGQCTEYCGDSHANMRIEASVDSAEDWAAWVKNQQTNPTPAQFQGDAVVGATIFRSKCISCHTINGDPIARVGIIGPNLTHVGSRKYFGAGMYETNQQNLAHWLRDPQAAKPGSKMLIPAPPLTEAEVQAVAAYLLSLK